MFKRVLTLSFIELCYLIIIIYTTYHPTMIICLHTRQVLAPFANNFLVFRTKALASFLRTLPYAVPNPLLHFAYLWLMLALWLNAELVAAVHSCCSRWGSPEPVIHLLLLPKIWFALAVSASIGVAMMDLMSSMTTFFSMAAPMTVPSCDQFTSCTALQFGSTTSRP